ncbi:hypothetical protein BHQ21_09650 [Mycobacterium sherrisii]|uniref:Uncharacterized protein n=1 Tax=Mycobacterium sherrisii TaxID=243061 RepID=A0A1E3SYS6_9MYCO|nr:hypothetical protein [Mycobacterium sherrisii]ODR07307.1 hypothetical protein BHQ21_09650 [Mycobacterium sherrisii]
MAEGNREFRSKVTGMLGLPAGASDSLIEAAIKARVEAKAEAKAQRAKKLVGSLAKALGIPAESDAEVFRQKMCEKMGLPADTSVGDVGDELNRRITANATEAAARREDERLVEAAAASGRLPLERKQFWINAMRTDRARNRQLLASLPAAAVPPAAAKTDMLGFPITPMRGPVRLSRGVSPSEYNREQQFDHFLHMLGGPLKAAANPLPPGDGWYVPGPNDPCRPVVGPDGTVTHWEDNPNYQPHC